ncbi:MAG TPA: TonB-dependent receptor plug domain-containing protein, partial [Sphingomonadaceae bacterium]|nr:TonB-dependent receptor plug domain-containing protein [Sphingomonadaceae bacterium]
MLTLGGGALGSEAAAQDVETPETGSSAISAPGASTGGREASEIVVTGSRIVRRDYVANSPITTVDSDNLQQASQVTLDSLLARLPQFTAGNNNRAGGSGQNAGSGGFGNTGVATLSLRNLGENRNLVLLDGRRLQPATEGFAVDVNAIPSSIVERVEVITGGASAVYGSDAVAGVVNFKLRQNFNGLELNLRKGISEEGDYDTFNVSALLGSEFADNRGRAMLAVDYAKRGIVYLGDRDFYRRAAQLGQGQNAYAFLGTGYYAPTPPNLPDGALVGALAGAPGAVPGTTAIGFNADGSIFTQSPIHGYTGGLYPNGDYAIRAGTNGAADQLLYLGYDDLIAATPLERYSAFGRIDYEVADDLNVYGQILYTKYDVELGQFRAAMAANNGTQIPRDAGHPVPVEFQQVLDSRPTPGAPWFYQVTPQYVD